MQIRTTRRDHLTPDRMAVIHKPSINKCLRECGERGTLLQYGWECRLVQPLCKSLWRYLKILKMDRPLDPAIPLLEPKTLIWEKVCTPMFISMFYKITKIWKQPKCPSVDEWINQLRDIYTWNTIWAEKEEESFPLCVSVDGPGQNYAQWNKPVRERQLWYDFTHMWNLKKKLN